MAIDTLTNMTSPQLDAIAKLRLTMSRVNEALAEAAAAGLEIDLDKIEVTEVGDRARRFRLTASVRMPSLAIA